jgi:UDP-N-acetylmuramoylalanine--D-glutamate ligase
MRELRNKTVLVAGMGKSGVAAAELLLEQGARVIAADERSADELGETAGRLNELGVPLMPQSAETFTSADLIVLSPGVPVDIAPVNAAREKGITVIGEVELTAGLLQGPIIGITGANGKTTTTAMIGHILRQSRIPVQVGGNIGTPPTAMIGSSRPDQWNVLELSSFQLETISEFRAHIGVALNVTPDHLDRHHTFDNYANAKARLFETQEQEDYAVLNADDPVCESYAKRTRAEVVWFSRTRSVDRGVWLNDTTVVVEGVPLIQAAEIPLKGVHNIENTMAAAAAARLAGSSLERIRNAVKSFPGVEHRLEFVRDLNGAAWYNDSKATNVDASEKAIDAFRGGLWIILGGKDKGSDYSVLREKLRQKARAILLIGSAAGKIASQLNGLPVVQCGTLDVAVQRAASGAVAGETVLLAPACASFDQFQSYEHRGRVFKELVRAL